MSNETYLTVIGRLAAEPELRFLPNGTSVATFTVASNARFYDKQADDWRDKTATFWRCQAWKELAESVAENLHKGDAVLLYGEIESREWEDKEGNKRTAAQVRVEAVGQNLRWTKATRQSSQPADTGWGGADSGTQPPF